MERNVLIIEYVKTIEEFLKKLEEKNRHLEIYCGEKYVKFFPQFMMTSTNFARLSVIPKTFKVKFIIDTNIGHPLGMKILDEENRQIITFWNINEVSQAY